jgi:raffinose/stachyose/melibiose transport system permease protein
MTTQRYGPGPVAAAPARPAEHRRTGRARRASAARLLGRGSKITMWAGLLLGVGFYVVFAIAPSVGNLLVSLTNYSGLAGSSTAFTGLSNYLAIGTTESPGFITGLEATAVFVVGVTVLQNGFALLLAHRLQGEGRFDAFLRVLVFLPIVLGVTVAGLIWILIFNPDQGPASALLGAFGIHSAFFGSSTWAMPLVIGVQVWQNLGFSTLVFVGALKAINPEIYQAASIDGIGPWQRLRRITFPLLAPAVTVNVLLATVGSFTTYNLIYVLTDGQNGTDTLGMLSFNSAFGTSANLGYGAAVSMVLFILTLLVALPLVAWLRRRERRLFT